jgi:non-heme chloroperoxidase
VAGLIYLDAGYSYAFYSPAIGDTIIDAKELHHQLDLLFQAKLQDPKDFAQIEANTARFDQDLKDLLERFASMPAGPPRPKTRRHQFFSLC